MTNLNQTTQTKTFKILNWMEDVVKTIQGTEEDAKIAASDLTEYHSCYASPIHLRRI